MHWGGNGKREKDREQDDKIQRKKIQRKRGKRPRQRGNFEQVMRPRYTKHCKDGYNLIGNIFRYDSPQDVIANTRISHKRSQ